MHSLRASARRSRWAARRGALPPEQEDRGNKWQHYQLIPSLDEYVLVSQAEARVERYRRLPSGAWEYTDVTDGVLQLSTGATIDLAKLYDGLPD